MNYFLAEYDQLETKISIITDEHKVIDSKKVNISDENYIQHLAQELIELSHDNKLYHNDITGIGMKIEDYHSIYFNNEKQLKKELESVFGFKAFVNRNYKELLSQLIN